MKRMNYKVEIFIISLFIVAIIAMIGFIMPKDIYFSEVNADKKIALNSKFKDDIFTACYGNKFFKEYSYCQDISGEIEKTGEVNTSKEGEYVLIYTVNYKEVQKTINQTVEVVFDTKPIIDLMEKNEVIKCPLGNYYEPEYKAYDEKEGNITNNVITYVENNQMIYFVENSIGNNAKASREIILTDNEKPNFILNGDKEIHVELNQEFIDPGYSVIDNCDGDLINQVITSNDVDTSKEGIYLILYSITDSSGNVYYTYRKVIVGNPILPNQDKIIYLTYDDGPNQNTENLLKVLARYDIKVTFFITGQFPRYHYVLSKIHEEGHAIGLHTYSHVFKNIYANANNFFADLDKINNVLIDYTGQGSKIIRFAGGTSNNYVTKNNMRELINQATEKGYVYFDWNVDSEDTKYANPNDVANSTIRQLSEDKPYYNVLQHDIKFSTAEAAEQIIRFGIKNGYKFESLTTESPVVHHR